MTLAITPAFGQGADVADCKTIFPKSVDDAALSKRFGRDNVVSTDLDGAEGSKERGTAIFPNNPGRRVEIFWHDEEALKRPSSITIRNGSQWSVRIGGKVIGLGTPIADIEQINGKTFKITGFGWDMGGYAVGWNSGKFDSFEGGCDIAIRFNPDPNAKPADFDKVSGEKEFASSAPAIKAVKPTVSEISLGWAEE